MNVELKNIFIKTITSANPGKMLGSRLNLNGNELKIADFTFSLNNNCYLVGFGKAVYSMAVELENILGKHLQMGIVSVPVGYSNATFGTSSSKLTASQLSRNSTIKVIEGGRNNLPDVNSFKATIEIKKLVERCRENHLLFVLISGGGSALLSYPTPPLSLEEKCDLIGLLSSTGASIGELNIVRKALSEVKGGKLAMLAFPSTVIAFIISDIVGDPIELIASGPTVLSTDRSSENVFSILDRYGLLDSIAENVKNILCSQEHDSTSLINTNAQYRQYFSDKVHNMIVGNNATILNGIKKEAELAGHSSIVLSRRVDGSIDRVVELYVEIVNLIVSYQCSKSKSYLVTNLENILMRYPIKYTPFVHDIVSNITDNFGILESCWAEKKTLFLICGGEPTVKVRGKGVGGRNQELALRMAIELNKLKCNYHVDTDSIFFSSLGTDGIDGPTDAAGAIVSGSLIDEALEQGLNPLEFLLNNDAYTFFSLLKDGVHLLKCGHTGVNVMDVHVIVFNMRR